MAEAEREGEEVFKALGKVEVDLDALKKSLLESERLTKESMDRHAKIMSGGTDKPEGTFGGGLKSRVIGGGEGSGGTAREAGKQAREFTHLTRTLRELLAGPLIALDPAFAKAANAAAYAARSSLHFGVALGTVAVAGVLVSEVLGEYLKQAKEATAVTVEASQALKALDESRADAAIQKIVETLALFNTQMGITEGKIEATFFQKMLAWWDRLKEGVTGSIDIQIEHLKKLILVQEDIAQKFKIPKAIAESEQAAAKLAASIAQDQIKGAASSEELAKAQEDLGRALKDTNVQQLRSLELDKQRETAANPVLRSLDEAVEKLEGKKKKLQEQMNKTFLGKNILAPEAIESLRGEVTKIDKEIEETHGRGATIRSNIDQTYALKAKDINDTLANTLRKNAEQQVADYERVAKAGAATSQILLDSEQAILQIRRAQAGQSETVTQLEDRLGQARENSLKPLRDSLDFATEQYEANKKGLEEQIEALSKVSDLNDAETAKLARDRESLKDIEKGYNQFRVANARETTEAIAKLAAREAQERQAQMKAAVDVETKELSHRVATGRATMEEQMDAARRAMSDPRRSLDEQRKAEEDLFNLKNQYAEKYFKLFDSMGQNTWAQQIQYAESALSQTVEGTSKWFDAVQKVADTYKNIHDTAKGIANTAIGIAEAEARRQGRTRISRAEVGGLVNQARMRAGRALAGGRVELGELSGALNNQDFFRQMDTMGLRPGDAMSIAMQNPQFQLSESLNRASTVAGTTSGVAREGADQIGGLGSAAGETAGALRDLTDAIRTAKGAVENMGPNENPREAMEAADKQSMAETRARMRISTNGGLSWMPMPTVTESAVATETARGVKRGVQP